MRELSEFRREIYQEMSRETKRIGASVFAFVLMTFISSCANFGNSNSISASQATQTSVTSTNATAITLLQVVAAADGSANFDFVGQNGQFDQYCSGTTSGITNACECEYSYTQNGIGAQTVDETPLYQETDLLRCANGVPAGITSFTAIVKTTNGTYQSNPITVTMNNNNFGGSQLFLDLSNLNSYLQVQRFQCRIRWTIGNMLQGTATNGMIYDPFQSEDPSIIYPFNFYTTSVGQSIVQIQATAGGSWDCTLTPAANYALPSWANPLVFSQQPCTSDPFCSGEGDGGQLMYPPTSLTSGKIPVSVGSTANGHTRASFYLAQSSYGVFNQPLNAMAVPTGNTAPTTNGNTAGVAIGYAAQSIPNSTGTSSCPNIQLPPNTYWVKVWGWRATNVTPSQYVQSTNSSYNSGGIACVAGGTSASAVFAGCTDQTSFNTTAGRTPASDDVGILPFSPTPLDNITSPTANQLASRVIMAAGGMNACYNIGGPNNVNPPSNFNINNASEVWQRGNFIFNQEINATYNTPYSSNSPPTWVEGSQSDWLAFVTQAEWTSMQNLPWNINLPALQTTAPGYLDGRNQPIEYEGVPNDSNRNAFVLQSLGVSGSNDNYNDYLFTVTPVTVDDTAMRNGGSNVSQYFPVSYRNMAACPGPTTVGCGSEEQVNWQIDTVGFSNQATGQDFFPVCAIQETN